MARKNFKKHNTGFICKNCGAENPPAPKSERNHCFSCLYSLHVDRDTPGDRVSDCHGLMQPIGLDHDGKKGFMIIHECVKCRKKMKNQAAEDDKNISRLQ